MNPPLLSILVPCYHDEKNLPELHRRISAVVAPMAVSHEIVLIDDGSADDTWRVICSLAKHHPEVRGIRLSRNFGHQLAVSAGLKIVRGDRVLIMDSDLQDPPELLPEMMKLMDGGAENVYGQRTSRDGTPLWRRVAYKWFYRVLGFLAETRIPADTGDFRLISRRVVDAVNAMPERHRFLRGMISWTGFNQQPIRYHRDPRFSGASGYTLAKLLAFAFDGITSFSIKPLRIATLLGLLTGVLSMACAAYVVTATLAFGRPVQGWASLMVAVLFVGSLQLFVLGIIGEYLGRLFLESKVRPLYFVSAKTPETPQPSA